MPIYGWRIIFFDNNNLPDPARSWERGEGIPPSFKLPMLNDTIAVNEAK